MVKTKKVKSKKVKSKMVTSKMVTSKKVKSKKVKSKKVKSKKVKSKMNNSKLNRTNNRKRFGISSIMKGGIHLGTNEINPDVIHLGTNEIIPDVLLNIVYKLKCYDIINLANTYPREIGNTIKTYIMNIGLKIELFNKKDIELMQGKNNEQVYQHFLEKCSEYAEYEKKEFIEKHRNYNINKYLELKPDDFRKRVIEPYNTLKEAKFDHTLDDFSSVIYAGLDVVEPIIELKKKGLSEIYIYRRILPYIRDDLDIIGMALKLKKAEFSDMGITYMIDTKIKYPKENILEQAIELKRQAGIINDFTIYNIIEGIIMLLLYPKSVPKEFAKLGARQSTLIKNPGEVIIKKAIELKKQKNIDDRNIFNELNTYVSKLSREKATEQADKEAEKARLRAEKEAAEQAAREAAARAEKEAAARPPQTKRMTSLV